MFKRKSNNRKEKKLLQLRKLFKKRDDPAKEASTMNYFST